MMLPSVPYSYSSRATIPIFLDDKGVIWRGRVFIKNKKPQWNNEKKGKKYNRATGKKTLEFSDLTPEDPYSEGLVIHGKGIFGNSCSGDPFHSQVLVYHIFWGHLNLVHSLRRSHLGIVI